MPFHCFRSVAATHSWRKPMHSNPVQQQVNQSLKSTVAAHSVVSSDALATVPSLRKSCTFCSSSPRWMCSASFYLRIKSPVCQASVFNLDTWAFFFTAIICCFFIIQRTWVAFSKPLLMPLSWETLRALPEDASTYPVSQNKFLILSK